MSDRVRVNILAEWSRLEQSSAPVLLVGNNDEEMEAAMKDLVLEMMCERGQGGCGNCRQCKTIINEVHPDVHWIRTELKSLGIKITKKGFREVTLTATNSLRFILIPRAELMTIPAANSLLKSLEDSKAGIRILLSTKWPSRLLPTILSRCQRWNIMEAGTGEKEISETVAELGRLGVLERLVMEQSVKSEDMEDIGRYLSQRLKMEGPDRELLGAMMRWRDYYRIVSDRGNEKLAKQMVLVSLPKKIE